ncbi:MAG: 3-phosphoshikimate 1-carboxyvinyltransferase [Pyrinomonadaceae bacterium]
MIIKPAKSLSGNIAVPGDKSISHRAVIVAAMADGNSRITNFSTGQDCETSIRCLRQLGVAIAQDGSNVVVRGNGKKGFHASTNALDCGNSGTTMRLLAGLLAGQDFESVLVGDESLMQRPMKRIIEPLRQMGANVESNDGLAPIEIRPRSRLKAIRYETPVASAQLKSCILLAGLNASGGTTVIENTHTRDHTELMLRWFGADITVFDEDLGNGSLPKRVKVLGDSILHPKDIEVPGDISSAVYFIAAASCLSESRVEIQNVGINPTRSGILQFLAALGADIDLLAMRNTNHEPSADIVFRGRDLLAHSAGSNLLDGKTVAGVIDEIPIIAVMATQIEGGIEIRDAGELRLKETDRIAAVVENLRRMGATVEEFDDGMRVERSHLKGAEVDSFGDHRIAMSFAVAGLFADGETNIKNPECADISFPGFFEMLESVVQR